MALRLFKPILVIFGLAAFFLNYVDTPALQKDFFLSPNKKDLIFITIASLGICALITYEQLTRISKPLFFFLLLLLAISIHYRTLAFYQWDEWNRLHLLASKGFLSALEPQNEHFKPLFFFWYYSLAAVFRAHYEVLIFAGFLLHSVASFLFYRLIKRVTAPLTVHSEQIARIAAILFAINGLHTSVLQWAFLHCILLCQISILSSALLAWDYCREGSRARLVGSGLFAAVCPLLFGNGFIVLPCVGILLLVLLGVENDNIKRKVLISRSIAVLSLILFTLLPSIACYAWLSTESTAKAPSPALVNPVGDFFLFLFYGAEAGTLLRGLGFFPFVKVDAPKEIITEAWTSITPETFLIYAGIFLSLLFVGFGGRKNLKRSLGFWLVAQLWLLSTYLLPALGRSANLPFALFPRYTYFALPALVFLALPLLLACSEHKQKLLSVLSGLLLFSHIGVQLNFAITTNYFTEHGRRGWEYYNQLKDLPKTEKLPGKPNTFPAIIELHDFYPTMDYVLRRSDN